MVQCLAPDEAFAALGDSRRACLGDLLSQRDHTVSELAATQPISLQGTLKHLAVLGDAGVVSRSKQGRTVTVHLEARDGGTLVGVHHTTEAAGADDFRLGWTDCLARLGELPRLLP